MLKLTRLPVATVLTLIILTSACSSNTATPSATMTQQAPELGLPMQADPTIATTQRLRIKHHMVECEGYQVTHCLLTQKEGNDEWFYFYEPIEGFEYQWGNDYELLVSVQKSDSQLADASELTYSLIEITTQKQHTTGEAFHFVSRNTHERITELADGRFSLLGRKSFTCQEDSCDNLRSAMAQNQSTVLSFQHSNSPTQPLVLASVLCSDSNPSFAESCLKRD